MSLDDFQKLVVARDFPHSSTSASTSSSKSKEAGVGGFKLNSEDDFNIIDSGVVAQKRGGCSATPVPTVREISEKVFKAKGKDALDFGEFVD